MTLKEKDKTTTVIYGFDVGVEAAEAVKSITATNCSVQILNSDRTPNTSIIATGNIVQIKSNKDNAIISELLVVIYGDVNGDGQINAKDMLYSMQFDYADSAQPDAGQFIYYMKLINELHGEAGLSGSQVSDLPVTGKLAEDFAFLENARLPYQFSSFYAGALESTDVSAALGWEDMASVRTVVRPYTGGGGLIGYETDRVTWQTAVTDGLSHTYRSDLRMRGVETALAYTSVLVDMLDTVYPETVDDTWGLISKNLTSDVPSAWKSFGKFDATTVSECDGRVRDFLAMDYDSSYDGTTVRISRSGSGPAWFILRINQQTVDTVTGGSAVRLESGAFLIEAQAPEVTVALRVVHDAPA